MIKAWFELVLYSFARKDAAKKPSRWGDRGGGFLLNFFGISLMVVCMWGMYLAGYALAPENGQLFIVLGFASMGAGITINYIIFFWKKDYGYYHSKFKNKSDSELFKVKLFAFFQIYCVGGLLALTGYLTKYVLPPLWG